MIFDEIYAQQALGVTRVLDFLTPCFTQRRKVGEGVTEVCRIFA